MMLLAGNKGKGGTPVNLATSARWGRRRGPGLYPTVRLVLLRANGVVPTVASETDPRFAVGFASYGRLSERWVESGE